MDAFDFTDIKTLGISFLLIFLIVFLRYLLFSGVYHWIFLVVFKEGFKKRILSIQPPKINQTKRELLLSVYSAIIFTGIALIILLLWQKGFTKIYSDLFEYPMWYMPVSIFLFLILHDAYYYWLHVWMHSSKWIHRFHMEHHKSIHTTVFTSFSFHPFESFLQAVIVPILFMIIPMNPIAILVTLTIMTLSAIINHAGVEIYPSNKKLICLSNYLIGATHHDHHHRNSKRNFGLYFTFWDWIMKTEQEEDYEP